MVNVLGGVALGLLLAWICGHVYAQQRVIPEVGVPLAGKVTPYAVTDVLKGTVTFRVDDDGYVLARCVK